MNRIYNITFLLLFSFFAEQLIGSNPIVSLHDNWQFRQVNTSDWHPANVPGTVHTDLIANNIIEDPFYRTNEHDLQWIDKVDWEYKTTFSLTTEQFASSKIYIDFKGLDTYAQVYLNDVLILSSENMFREFSIDCKTHLKQAENQLYILLESPIKKGVEKHDALDYTIPVSANDMAEFGQVEGNKRVGVFSRKANYHFGWDWGPRLVTSGIWRPIELRCYDDVSIDNIYLQQIKLYERAELEAHIEIESAIYSDSLSMSILVNGILAHSQAINIQLGSNTIQLPFIIQDPILWWPNGMGDQYLYQVEVSITGRKVNASKTESLGLRTIELVQEHDSIGTSFYFEVNGIPTFMKGTNYIPQDVFIPRVTTSQYDHILHSAADAHMNMIRVWGGGIYEEDYFYDKCDSLGLLVWQDFMFACAIFPGDEAFLENVAVEAKDNIKRLRNHPSIALWCGNNEIMSAWKNWGWQTTAIEEQGEKVAQILWEAYDNVFHKVLNEAVLLHDPQRVYWPSSPGAGFGLKKSWTSGDMHYWGVWWGKDPFNSYNTQIPRFMSEFGFQSFPDIHTVNSYTIPEDHDIFSDVMKSHQRSSIGNGTIEEYMLRHYKAPQDFESFLYVSHLLQAYGMRIGMESHRRNRARCMGSLYWQINDCWPVASWSGIDYYGRWKALHYAIKESFKPTIISYEDSDESIDIHICTDRLKSQDAILNLTLLTFEGKKLQQWKETVTIHPNISMLYHSVGANKFSSIDTTTTLLYGELKDANELIIDEGIFYFSEFKHLNLGKPNLTYSISEDESKYIVAINTDILAKDVYLSSPMHGNFSENYFDLLPNKTKIITISKSQDSDIQKFKEQLKILTLASSYKA